MGSLDSAFYGKLPQLKAACVRGRGAGPPPVACVILKAACAGERVGWGYERRGGALSGAPDCQGCG